MNKKMVWAVVSCLMVLALLATSCAKAEEKAPAVKEAAPAVKEAAPAAKEAAPAVKEAAPAAGAEMVKVSLTKNDGTKVEKLVEKPRYGGELIISRRAPILAWDEAYQAPWTLAANLAHTNQDLVMGDWMRGLSGTEEMTWQVGDWISIANATGELAESWEFPEPGTIIYHIRKGVKWHNKPPVNGREFTADDAAFNLKRIYIDLKTSTMRGMIGVSGPTEVYATDKYTVVVKVPPATAPKSFEEMSDLTKMVPPEVVKKYGDMNAWENVTGTGPFLLVDYVPMSSAVWVRNPNYWEYDPTLGKDYPLPYVDTLKSLIIPDASTEMAAMRTGKIDIHNYPGDYTKEDFEQLFKTRPDLQYVSLAPWGCLTLGWRIDKPELPYDDLRVRQALLMAVDNQKITDTYYRGDAIYPTYKVPPHPEMAKWYTPLAELPPSTKELFTYNPEKAKQLLAEAGYPNGFKTEVVVDAGGAEYLDLSQILQSYWAKIGVDLKIDTKETGTFYSIYQRKTHEHALFCGRARMVTSMYMCRKGNMYNWGMVDDPKLEQYYEDINGAAYFKGAERDKLVKEMNLYVLSQAYYYSPPRPTVYKTWQPWVKNYHGEMGPGYYSQGIVLRYLWIDQELKKAMGH